ncbi:MAG: hypothetical protein EOP19_00300 [Hyphomicrobiales bacterium]|nr:MAG: hypothetical protein EOP19_00300 [Hyphomicrobiales bacterium]
MQKRDLDRLLEQAVADALGLSLAPLAKSHHRVNRKLHRGHARKHSRPLVIGTRYTRVPAHA